MLMPWVREEVDSFVAEREDICRSRRQELRRPSCKLEPVLILWEGCHGLRIAERGLGPGLEARKGLYKNSNSLCPSDRAGPQCWGKTGWHWPAHLLSLRLRWAQPLPRLLVPGRLELPFLSQAPGTAAAVCSAPGPVLVRTRGGQSSCVCLWAGFLQLLCWVPSPGTGPPPHGP